MSLDSIDSILGPLSAPVKLLDEQLQKLYTIIGQRIPEKRLYKTIAGLHAFGYTGAAFTAFYTDFAPFIIMLYGAPYGFVDGGLTLEGLIGRLPQQHASDTTQVLNQEQYKCLSATKFARLPTFLAGAGLLAKFTYHVINFFMNNEPLEASHFLEAASGLGLLSAASSMYLKDQDPKLLERSPSKAKAFNRIYESIKGLLPSPEQTAEPVPIRPDADLVNEYQLLR